MSRRSGGDSVSGIDRNRISSANVPIDHLLQIQRKLQALVASLGQLRMEIAMAPSLDWPVILSRYGTLVSQTYSLSSSLTSGSSTFLPAQVDNVHRLLEEEAKTSNYFMSEEAALQSQSTEGIPVVKFTDVRNPLPKLAATPVTTLDGDKTARLGEALRTKLDPDVSASHDEVLRRAAPNTGPEKSADANRNGHVSTEQLNASLRSTRAHDELAMRALRAWYHVRWRPDEDDQVYDFRMRLGEEDTGELDDEQQGDDDEAREAETVSVGESGYEREGPEADLERSREDGVEDHQEDADADADADMEDVM